MLSATLVLLSLAGNALAQCQATRGLSWRYKPIVADGVATRVVYNGLTRPRGVQWAGNALLVVDRGVGIVALTEDTNGCDGWTRTLIVENSALNHGIAVDGSTLYASTSDEVFQYFYDPSTQRVSGEPAVFIRGMDNGQEHITRTLDIQVAEGNDPAYLIVSAGSSERLDPLLADPLSGQGQIRRFAIGSSAPSSGYRWREGELVAYGLRNAVGLRVAGGHIWALENSADEIIYQGQDVGDDNPAEELNRIDFATLGRFYGHPRCMTVWDMDGFSTNDQFSASNITTFDNEWCDDPTGNVPPVLALQPHTAPMDISFFSAPSDTTYSLPAGFNSHAFVSFRGSATGDPPNGYGIARIPWGPDGPTPARDSRDGFTYIFQAADLHNCPERCLRPVGVAIDQRGRLFGSSDATGEIFIIESATSPDALDQSESGSTIVRVSVAVVASTFAVVLASLF